MIRSGWRSSSRPQSPTSRFTLKLGAGNEIRLGWHSSSRPSQPVPLLIGAGNEIRTRDPNLGKVVLYQLSYSRFFPAPGCPDAKPHSTRAPVSVKTVFAADSISWTNFAQSRRDLGPPGSAVFATAARVGELRYRRAQIGEHGPQRQRGGQVQTAVSQPQPRRHDNGEVVRAVLRLERQ